MFCSLISSGNSHDLQESFEAPANLSGIPRRRRDSGEETPGHGRPGASVVLKHDGGVEAHEFRLIPVAEPVFGEDPGMRKLIERGLGLYRERMNHVLCRSEVPILRYDVLETNADNLITDALREATGVEICSPALSPPPRSARHSAVRFVPRWIGHASTSSLLRPARV